MPPGDWIGLLAGERLTSLRHEAERRRLIRLARPERGGSMRRRGRSIAWPSRVGPIQVACARPPLCPRWRGSEPVGQGGEQG
jgi:hypothetical protein